MTKVITYGTYDLLHYGHIKLLERAKSLGDYLIVGVTADDFDRTRGKINVQQSLMERIENVRQTGLADEIIVEEYEGQKIDDIKKYNIDIFTVGSDWVGKFDYLNEFCKVVYLDRTQGISSSEIRAAKNEIKLGIIGESPVIAKFIKESEYVNGIRIIGICSESKKCDKYVSKKVNIITDDYHLLLENIDAIYVISPPQYHYDHIKEALKKGKHVLCESPIALTESDAKKLYALAEEKKLVLVDGIKTAYSTAFARMILLAKGGKIGDIVSVDSICTSLKEIDYSNEEVLKKTWNSLTAWGPTALLPIFNLLGCNYNEFSIYSRMGNIIHSYDEFTKITFCYPSSVASIKVGKGVKSEGELIISGTKGYIYIPAPWWKTDYFEIRYEESENNKRYFFQLDGEGIRNEIVSFIREINGKIFSPINKEISIAIVRIMEAFMTGKKVLNLTK